MWLEQRDRKPDCSGLRNEWEAAGIDSFEKCGCLARGRQGWRLLKDAQACQHLWVMGRFHWSKLQLQRQNGGGGGGVHRGEWDWTGSELSAGTIQSIMNLS